MQGASSMQVATAEFTKKKKKKLQPGEQLALLGHFTATLSNLDPGLYTPLLPCIVRFTPRVLHLPAFLIHLHVLAPVPDWVCAECCEQVLACPGDQK